MTGETFSPQRQEANDSMSDAIPTAIPNEFRGTIGVERKINLGDYEHEVVSHFVQYEVVPGDEERTAINANDAAFLAKTVVYSQLGLDTELNADGVLRVKAAFPGTQVLPTNDPRDNPGIAGGVPQEAAAAAPTAPTSAPAASGSDVPVCPVDPAHGVMYDNRAKNVERANEGKPKIPEARCRQHADPPKGQGCSGIIWNIAKGK